MTTIEVVAERSLLISYLALRRAIGLLGISLPIVLAIGGLVAFGHDLQGSISTYYYTGMRNIFVGTQWAMGSFFFSYRGYGLADQIAGKLACLGTLGIALFPTSPEAPSPTDAIVSHFHSASTALFFAVLAYFALVLFTKTSASKPPTPRKLQRSRVYRMCGCTIGACMILILAHNLLPGETTLGLKAYRPVFALETLAVIAFGLSWLVKGEAILKDDA